MRLTFGSGCSGIEAASVAWEPLGWRASWFAEIEPFPSAVLAHHWPEVPNLGDFTGIAGLVRFGEAAAPDVLVAGTPCQSFSVAGLRAGLSDPRGGLTLAYVELTNAVDAARREQGDPPCVVVWENVPGVLTSRDNAFGCLLAAMAGDGEPYEPAGGRRWPDAGAVFGPQRAVAWRVVDAQHFGLAQRRRRVFLVASARQDFHPAQVLFEFDGVRRDTPPSRETGEGVAAGTLGGTSPGGGWRFGADEAAAGHLIPVAFGGNNTAGPIDVATARNACSSSSGRLDFESETFVVHGTQDPCVSRHTAFALGRNNGGENAVCVTGDVTHTLKAEGFDASEDGTGRRQPIVHYGQAGVRRLMPVECERLQGFPDGHTAVLYGDWLATDSPRYKAIGNSMAVACMRWLGERIEYGLRSPWR